MGPVKIIVFTLVALAVLFVILLGANFLFLGLGLFLAKFIGINPFDALGGWGGTLLLALAIYLMPKGWLAWNRKYECHGSEVIDAPIEDVWSWLQIRPRDDYFTSAISRIRAVPGTDDEFLMLFDEKLNDDEDDIPNHVHVKIVDEVEQEYLAYYVVNVDDLPLFGKDHLMTEILLTQQEDGVKVTYIETLSRLTIGSFLAFLFLNPAKDAMASLKAQMEGYENPSLLQKWTNGTGEDGAPPAEVKRAIWVSGATGVIATTALAGGVIYLLSRIVTM